MKALSVFCCNLVLFLGAVYSTPLEARKSRVQASLISENQSFIPGNDFWVGVKLKMDPGWHTYWINPGESGLPTRIQWKLPKGFKAGKVLWPAPKRFGKAPVISYGYDGEVLLMTKIETDRKTFTQDGEILEIWADVNWLECADICLPGEAKVRAKINVNMKESVIDNSHVLDFIKARRSLPLKKHGWNVKAKKNRDKLRLIVSASDVEEIAPQSFSFIPRFDGLVDESHPQKLYRMSDSFVLEAVMPKEAKPSLKVKGVLTVKGKIGRKNSEQHLDLDLPLE